MRKLTMPEAEYRTNKRKGERIKAIKSEIEQIYNLVWKVRGKLKGK